MIELQNVCYTIGTAKLIQNISVSIEEGDFIAIIGENGAGKTTITKLIAGLLKPTGGCVLLNKKDTKKMGAKDIAQNVSYLFQNPDKQICQKTVREELLFGLETLRATPEEKEIRLKEILSIFHMDPEIAPFSLSRGQRQMLAFASVMIMKPPVLILDEPTTGLDYRECMLMMNLVQRLNDAGTTVIMVSHDMEIVADFAKKILVMHQGQIIAFDDSIHVMRDNSVLQKASVLPAQIIGLSTLLGKEYTTCNTVDELADCIEKNACVSIKHAIRIGGK